MPPLKIVKYQKLTKFLEMLNKRQGITFTIIESRGGLGKTYISTHTLKDHYLMSGHITPLSLYVELWKWRDKIIIIDDAEAGLLKKPAIIAMLKQLCDTLKDRTIQYHSSTTLLTKQQIPGSFNTTSPLLILTNQLDVRNKDKHMGALLTRGFWIQFEPSNKEILKQSKVFFKDQAILDYINQLIIEYPNSIQINLRTMIKGKALRDSGLKDRDWKKLLSSELITQPEV